MRNFETGATRDSDESKFDYEGFLSPTVLEAYAAYMHKNRFQADGKIRDSDNWQKGIPLDAYMKSMFRHFMAVWKGHRKGEVTSDELAALMFNVMGYLHEKLKLEQKVRTTIVGDGWETTFPFTDVSPRAQQNAWDLGVTAMEANAQHYTHRYGALAHDAEAIEDDDKEAIEEDTQSIFEITYHFDEGYFWTKPNGSLVGPYKTAEEADQARENYNKVWYAKADSILYPHSEGYEGGHTQSDVSSVAGVDGSEVVGVSSKRVKGEVAQLAPEVESACRCETCVCGCKWG